MKQAGRIEPGDLPLSGDLLTIFVDEKNDLGRRVHSQAGQDGLYLVILLLTEQKRGVCH